MTKKIFIVFLIGYTFTGVTWAEVVVEPTQQVIREGNVFQFVCHTGQPVDTCRIELPSHLKLIFRANSRAPDLSGYDYAGNGFKDGDCGLRIEKTDLTHNGIIKCIASFPNSITQVHGQTQLTVAKAPQTPEITLNKQDYKNGDRVKATCTVRNGRPVANISWFIGDDRITTGLQPPQLFTEDPKQPDVKSVSQNLSRPLSWRDHGKKLRCVAKHISYDRDMFIDKELQIRFAPQPHRAPLEQSGLEMGNEGWITVVVAANPKPVLHWRVDETVIPEDSIYFEPRPAQKMLRDPGRWEAILRVVNVTADVFDKTFILTATNELGAQNYTVTIYKPTLSPTMIAVIAGIVSFFVVICISSLIFCCSCKSSKKHRGATKLQNMSGDSSGNEGYLTPRPPDDSPVYDVLNFNDEDDDDNHTYEYVTAPRGRTNAPLLQPKQFSDPTPLYKDVPLPPSGPIPIPFIDAPNLPPEREEDNYDGYVTTPTRQTAMANGLKPIIFKFNEDTDKLKSNYGRVNSTAV